MAPFDEEQHGGHMQCTDNKGLEAKVNDEKSGSAEFWGVKKESGLLPRDKPVLLDVQQFDF